MNKFRKSREREGRITYSAKIPQILDTDIHSFDNKHEKPKGVAGILIIANPCFIGKVKTIS